MAILYKNAKLICQNLSKTVNEMQHGLSFFAIPHHDGQRNDALTIEATNFSGHKAEQFMRRIISNNRLKDDQTSYLGAAVAFEQGLFGMYYKALRISLLTVNIDQYDDLNELKADLYHHLWLALNKDAEIKKAEHGGQHEHHKYPMKSDKLALTRRNLNADIFSVLMQSFENIPDAPLTLGKTRSTQAVKAEPSHKALYYAFPLAMEACQFLLDDLQRMPINQQSQITIALKLAEEVSSNVNDESIQSWWEFAEPAATMAWLDYSKQEILSACVNSGLDPLIRANGILLQEILDVELLSPKDLKSIYNSFGDKAALKELHEEQGDTSFEEALIQGIKTSSNRPFLDEALFQNERLSQGKALGWTASALQASAKAFDKALKTGRTPEQAARLEYEGVKSHSEWESLESLSHKILEARQDGGTTTLEGVVDHYAENQDYRNILESFEKTLADPAYTSKLSVDPSPVMPAAKPAGPAPQTPALELSAAPQQAATPATPAAAPAMGGMGGMGGGPPLRASKPLGKNIPPLEKQDVQTSPTDDEQS
tara:strand:- start:411185 stop:412807 length:1623 start_codon:yes stop_codon:yes gene_type:complete